MKSKVSRNLPKEYFHFLFLLALVLKFSNYCYAGSGSAITGNWNSGSTWNFSGSFRTPDCGDTLTIPPGITVTMNVSEDYSACSSSMVVKVQGTLQLTNGTKTEFPCSSSVVISSGGVLKISGTGGGNSRYIHICGCTAWTAGAGTVNGPVILNCSFLPITLLSFNAVSKADGITLSWSTASEINNDFFTVERSTDGYEFFEIERIKGAGTTSVENDYSYVDINPPPRIAYYRLKQTDYDGKSTYSEILEVKNESRNSLKLISNYIDDRNSLNLIFLCPKTSQAEIKLFDYSGKSVFESAFNTNEGLNQLAISLSTINKGAYILTLSSDDNSSSKMIMVR